MRTIWKYELAITDRQTLMLPFGASILTVQAQGDELYMWVLVDTDSELREPHRIVIRGTGHPITSDPGGYLGTVQTHGGKLVWHVFEMLDIDSP